MELITALADHPGPKDLLSKSSCFLGDPPPDPRFLASLGALSLVELITALAEHPGPKNLLSKSSCFLGEDNQVKENHQLLNEAPY